MYYLSAIAAIMTTIKHPSKTVKPTPTPINVGANTNHHDQSITPNSLATTKINVKILVSPKPFC